MAGLSVLWSYLTSEFLEFASNEEHLEHPYISETYWKEYKTSPDDLKTLDKLGKKMFEVNKEKYTLKVNENVTFSEDKDDLRIVLLGKTGVGKSATGNTIIGAPIFSVGRKAFPMTCKSLKHVARIGDRTISVVDTPGFFDEHRSKEEIFEEIARVMKIFSDGVHAFIYVLDCANPRLTPENKETIEIIEERFGVGVKDFRLVVYSKAEILSPSSLNEFYEEQIQDYTAISQFLRDLDWRIVGVNNETTIPAEKKRNQEVIIAMVDKLKRQNRNAVYTNEMFKEAAKKSQELEQKGEKEGWNPDIMEAVEVVMATDPNISKNAKKLTQSVRKLLEERQSQIENDLREVTQVREEEERCDTKKQRKEDNTTKDISERKQETRSQVESERQTQKQKQKHTTKREQLERQWKKHEMTYEEVNRKTLEEKETERGQNIEKDGERATEGKYKREESQETAEQQRTFDELEKPNEGKEEPTELQGGQRESTTPQPDQGSNGNAKNREDNRKYNYIPENENKEKQRKKITEGGKKEWRWEFETETEEMIHKQQKSQGDEGEKARRDREQLIKKYDMRLQLTQKALNLDRGNMTKQVTEIADEHDKLLISMTEMVASCFTRL